MSRLRQNGAEASRQIRLLRYQRLIIGVTGNALDDDVTTFLEAGADCVIPKPLRAAQLDAVLRYTATSGFVSFEKKKLMLVNDVSGGYECEIQTIRA
jgi:DNA-binding response OmpR family regulator